MAIAMNKYFVGIGNRIFVRYHPDMPAGSICFAIPYPVNLRRRETFVAGTKRATSKVRPWSLRVHRRCYSVRSIQIWLARRSHSRVGTLSAYRCDYNPPLGFHIGNISGHTLRILPINQ
jgi:hypothetical protein